MKLCRDSHAVALSLALGLALLCAPASAAPMPGDAVVRLIAKAHAAQAKGNTDLALRLAQSAIVAGPARTAGYNALADIYAAAGQSDYARNYYNEALAIDPSDSAALKAIAGLDRRSDDKASASNP